MKILFCTLPLIAGIWLHGRAQAAGEHPHSLHIQGMVRNVAREYHDTLTRFFDQVKTLKKGNMAPAFSLKDTTGRED